MRLVQKLLWRLTPVIHFEDKYLVPSEIVGKFNVVTRDENGKLTCDCLVFQVLGEDKVCSHIRKVAKQYGFILPRED